MPTNPVDIIAAPGFFGKMAAYGDFLCRRMPDPFLAPWNRWLHDCMAQSEARLGSAWPDLNKGSPVWWFALSAGICGDRPWAGVFLGGADRAGRIFPFTLAAELPSGADPLATLGSAAAWYADAELVALASRTPSNDLETFDTKVIALGSPPFLGENSLPARTQANLQERQTIAFALQDDPLESEHVWSDVLNKVSPLGASRASLWCTRGSEKIGPSLLVCTGLPSPEGFPAFLDGKWGRWGWQIQTLKPYKSELSC